MFDALKSRWFVSQVGAELKGQLRRQELVDEVISAPAAARAIERVRTDRDYLFVAGPRLLPYLAACEALAAAMEDARADENHRALAYEFLCNRLDRADELQGPILNALKSRTLKFRERGRVAPF